MQKYTVTIDDGNIRWYKKDTEILHRENGPAVERASGNKFWYKNGERHRLDGPAKEYADGDKEWWIEGREYTEAEFKQYTTKDTCDGKEVVIAGRTYKLSLVDKK